MTQLQALKNAMSLHNVAQLLEIKPASLSYLLYKKPASENYHKFEVPKKHGGVRHIAAPTNGLKRLQRKLANLLQNCIEEINKVRGYPSEGVRPDKISHGFKRKRSILTNARQHRRRRYVFNIDLEDFFESINFGRVRGFFIADKNFQLKPKVATVIAQIICFENALPQGSPCSPVVSNLIGHILDIELVRLSARLGCTYTRYADDLTFSTNLPEFPDAIARRTHAHEWVPASKIVSLIAKNGFAINARKTRMQYQDSRQEVTGLVVNRKVNVRSDYRHSVRAMVHRLITKGSFYLEKSDANLAGAEKQQPPGSLTQLHGMLGFIDWVDRSNSQRLEVKTPAKQDAKRSTYKRFLLYKNFYAAPQPVIVCEGKTDAVYVTQAIRSLAAEYPELAAVDAAGKVTLKIRRFRYTKTSTSRILNLNGGDGDLKNLLLAYHAEKFKAPSMRSPVIVLVDNDSGANAVFSTAKTIVGKTPERAAKFTRVTKNLYLMATPTPEGTAIENMFDEATRSRTLGTRTFNALDGADCKLHYGKADFAYEVVVPHATQIDFSGFKPLLDRLVLVINAHRESLAVPIERPC